MQLSYSSFIWFDFPSLANAFVFVSLGSSINLQSQPLDAFVTFLEKSQPCKETTIRVLCKLPIIDRHVVFLLLTLGTISTCLLYALAAKCSSRAVLHECYKIRDHYTVMGEPYDLGLRAMGHLCLLWSNFYGPKSHIPQASIQHNFIDPSHTRPARKPPD
jgi:hypothetical protein